MGLFSLFSGKRVDPGAQESGAQRLEQVLGEVGKLPLLPDTAVRAMEWSKSSKGPMTEFAHLVERDGALATGVLKLANSAYYGLGRSIDNLSQAVVCLGMRECQNLVLALSVRSLFRQAAGATRQRCEALWSHCFLVASLCRSINQVLGYGFEGEEFTAGLLHDLGRILLALAEPNRCEAADPLDFQEGSETLSREQNLLGFDHCSLGSSFANKNGLPDSVISAIKYHHSPAAALDHQLLIGLVATADHMANYIDRQDPIEAYDVEANPGFMFLSQKWHDETTTQFREQLLALLAHVAQVPEEDECAL